MQRGTVTAQDMFKAAQRPIGWLLSAERLRDAAEAILKDEVQYEIPYFRAYEAAVQEPNPSSRGKRSILALVFTPDKRTVQRW